MWTSECIPRTRTTIKSARPRWIRRLRLFAAAGVIGLAACAPAPTHPITPLTLDDGWAVSTPEEQGMRSESLARVFGRASERPYMYSVIVVRNGFLVAEAYFHGAAVDEAKYIASVTKSYMSALIGVAVYEGFIRSLDEPMVSFFPEYDSPDVEDAKRRITLRQLLEMRAGYWHDSEDSRWYAWVNSGDLVGYMMQLPLENLPGTQWNYSSGSIHLLSAILTKASGMPAEDFARRYLFEPTGTTLAQWGRDRQSYNLGGWDMYVTPRDLARFGQLYLDDGYYAGEQIVPAEWVRESTAPRSRVSWPSGALHGLQYASGWWVGSMRGHDVFMAQGHGGQGVVVVPDLQMVVVTTTNPNLGFAAAWDRSVETFGLIGNGVLAAVDY